MDFSPPYPTPPDEVFAALPPPVAPPALVRACPVPLVLEEGGKHGVAAEEPVEAAGRGFGGGSEGCPHHWLRVGFREVVGSFPFAQL